MLVHQKQVLVERFQRKSETLWLPTIYGAEDTLELASIGFTGAIADLYTNLNQLI